MKKFSKELKIGVAFLAAILILYYGISFLKGFNKFKPTDSYMVVFENVDGLTKSAPVTLNGFQIGKVFEITLDPNNRDRVIVYLSLDKGMEIPTGSKLSLENAMLEGASIVIELNPYTSELYTFNDTIYGIRKSGLMDKAVQLAPKLESIVSKLDSTLTGVEILVNGDDLKNTLSNINSITSDLKTTMTRLNSIASKADKDIPEILENVKTISNDLASASTQIKQLDIKSTFDSMDSTMKNIQSITNKVNSDQNSLGLLLNDRALYDSINATIGNASSLLKNVKDEPERYINIKVF